MPIWILGKSEEAFVTSTEKVLKLGLVGNIANNFSREAALVSRDQYIRPTCVVFSNKDEVHAGTPASDAVDVGDGSASELFYYAGPPDFWWFCYLLLPRMLRPIFPRRLREILNFLNRFDLCVYSGFQIPILSHVDAPGLIRATGSDLTVFPVLTWKEAHALGYAGGSLKDRIVYFIVQQAFRRGYGRAKGISYTPARPYFDALEGLPERLRPPTAIRIPLGIDQRVFRRVRSSNASQFLNNHLESKFIVFFPSRYVSTATEVAKRTGDWKASHVGLEGFANFLMRLDTNARQKAIILIPDRDIGRETSLLDTKAARTLVEELELTEHVVWIRGEDPSGLTRREMIPLYSSAHVTLDDFGVGWYGSVALEALSCESAVITYVKPEVLPNPKDNPFLVARTAEEVAEHLHELFKEPDYGTRFGLARRSWVAKYHAESTVPNAYRSLIGWVFGHETGRTSRLDT